MAVPSLALAESDFGDRVTTWYGPMQAAFEKASELAFAGETAAANKLLLDIVSADDNGIGAFVIGNMLFKSDREASYRLHKIAFDRFPDEPMTNLEFAMDLHCRGEHEAAIPLYKKAFEEPIGAQFSALLADCLVRTGRLEEAVQAWNAASHPNNHTGIDFAIYEIYGKTLPTQRRGDLIEKIKSGDKGLLADLIELDLNFDSDWWNSQLFEQGLDLDLKLATELLGADNAFARQLGAYAAIARNEDATAAGARQQFSAAGLIFGEGSVLPANSFMARGVCEMLVTRKFASADELLRDFSAELRERVGHNDRDALHLLCMLTVNSREKDISELDKIGWKEWHDPEFAVSYVAGLLAAGKISGVDDPELLAALDALPEDNILCGIRLQLAGEKNQTRTMIVAAIKAEFRHLSGRYLNHDSYTLKGLFHLLDQDLDKAKESSVDRAQSPGT